MAAEQVEELRLQRRAGPPGVEVGEERILGFLEHDRGVEPRGQPLGERRLADCASAPPAVVVPEAPTAIAWEEKLAWIMRLEDQRRLRDPDSPSPARLSPATARQPAMMAPAPPTDLIRLLQDEEARVRRRAALAVGRVGLAEGVAPLAARLRDEEAEVRQMAAFALGLIGDGAARPALRDALGDADPIVQGRAAEALGRIGAVDDADAVGAMVRAHVQGGAIAGLDPDDLRYPLAPRTEAVRLGTYALARMQSFEALAAAVLDASGQPLARWWPVAYALQEVGDARAAAALQTLVSVPSRHTASFAIRGLVTIGAPETALLLRQIVERRLVPPAVVMQAVRGLGTLADEAAVPLLASLVLDRDEDDNLRLEAMTALGSVASEETIDLLLDLLLDDSPLVRAAVIRTLARVAPDAFTAVLSGLDPDPDWRVRRALATALGTLSPERGRVLLRELLGDSDQRVVPAALAAMAEARTPGVEALLIERLAADDFMVRTTAASALADLGVTEAVPALQRAYRDGVGDSTYVARAAMLTALRRLDPGGSRDLLESALRDREWAVRLRAATLLRELGVADASVDDLIRPASAGRRPDDPEWRALGSPRFSPRVYLDTERGTIEIELFVIDAPLTVANFIALARSGSSTTAWRCTAWCPTSSRSTATRAATARAGPATRSATRSTCGPTCAAPSAWPSTGPDTGGSQYFITHSPQPHLDGRYTVFGQRGARGRAQSGDRASAG
jgi:HEAT repeat protein